MGISLPVQRFIFQVKNEKSSFVSSYLTLAFCFQVGVVLVFFLRKAFQTEN